MSWTLCMAGEQWLSGFVWHQNIMVTKYQHRAVSFIFTFHNLICLNSHCLITASVCPVARQTLSRPKTSLSGLLSFAVKIWNKSVSVQQVSLSLCLLSSLAAHASFEQNPQVKQPSGHFSGQWFSYRTLHITFVFNIFSKIQPFPAIVWLFSKHSSNVKPFSPIFSHSLGGQLT